MEDDVDGDDLAIDVAVGERDATVTLTGEVDLASAAALRSVLVEASSGPVEKLVVDMAGVTFIDSMGLSILIQAKHHLEAAGGGLTIVNPSERIRYVLEIAGVGDYLIA